MTVDEFVRVEAAKPFRWGDTDCASTADRWVKSVTGISPMSAFGRQHATEGEAREWLAEPGSIAVAVNRVMRKSGLKKTSTPRPGDVGLIVVGDAAGVRRLCMAIHAGNVWFSRDEDGFIGAPSSALWKAWRIQEGS